MGEKSNSEILEELYGLREIQLIDINKASYLNNFYSLLNLKNNLNNEDIKNVWKDHLENEVDIFNKHISFYIEFLSRAVGQNLDLKDIDKLIDYRSEMYRLSLLIEGYLMELTIQREIVDSYGVKLLAKNLENRMVNLSGTLGLVSKSLDNLDTPEKYITATREIINVLPFRLTRGNYYSILRKNLERDLDGSGMLNVENRIKYCKKYFDSSIYDNYGTDFLYYFVEVEKIRKMKKEELSLGDIGAMLQNIDKLDYELRDILNFIKLLGLINSRNTVIGFLGFGDIEAEVTDSYEKWMEELDEHSNIQNYNKKAQESIYELEKKIVEDLLETQNKLVAIYNEDMELYNETSVEFEEYRKILMYFNDVNFSEVEKIMGDSEIAGSTLLNLKIESLVNYIDRNIDGLENCERRIRMRKVLSIMDMPFENKEKLLDYIKYSLDEKFISKGEINFISNQLLDILNRLGKIEE